MRTPPRLYVIKWTPTRGRLRGMRHATTVTNSRWAERERERLTRERAKRITVHVYVLEPTR